jgi:hypothetical protein
LYFPDSFETPWDLVSEWSLIPLAEILLQEAPWDFDKDIAYDLLITGCIFDDWPMMIFAADLGARVES